MEKAVITELDRKFVTDNSQYGFQAGIQVTRSELSVLAALQKGADFIVVLDLAKAYDNIVKLLMQSKLDNAVDENIANQLTIFLITVYAQVTGDISNTAIAMLRGHTQGGTSSPALFRMCINELPKEVMEVL